MKDNTTKLIITDGPDRLGFATILLNGPPCIMQFTPENYDYIVDAQILTFGTPKRNSNFDITGILRHSDKMLGSNDKDVAYQFTGFYSPLSRRGILCVDGLSSEGVHMPSHALNSVSPDMLQDMQRYTDKLIDGLQIIASNLKEMKDGAFLKELPSISQRLHIVEKTTQDLAVLENILLWLKS